jgi:proteic killer suppression protein
VKIRTVRHKGLRRLIEANDATSLPPAVVEKLRNMISFLQDMARE